MADRLSLTADQVEAIRRLWAEGVGQSEICGRLGISVDRLRARLRDQLADLPARPRSANSGRRGRDPTEDEIEAACLEMRSRWTEEERMAHL